MNSVIQLIEEALKDASYFLVYYFCLLTLFVHLFMILGSVTDEGDYDGLTDDKYKFTAPYYFVQSFRNSIGDLQPPMYSFWIDMGDDGVVIIYLIWVIWILMILFTSVLMLNFLITVFSETHERVLANSVNYTYLTRASLNMECMAMLKTFGMVQDIDHVVLCVL